MGKNKVLRILHIPTWLRIIAAVALLLSAFDARAVRSREAAALIDSLNRMPADTNRLKQAYIFVKANNNKPWAIELIDFACEEASKLDADVYGHDMYTAWLLSFYGCKVRWCHSMQEWELMHRYLLEQRAMAFKLKEYGNYLSQIGESAIVMAQMGRFEQSWRYIKMMKRDMQDAGEDTFRKYDIYNYIVQSEYHRYHGDERQRINLLLAAYENNPVQANKVQGITLHLELIDVFARQGDYDRALAHADTVALFYDNYSTERKALPQSGGSLSEANLKKVGIYYKLQDYDKMRACLDTAAKYVNYTEPKNRGDVCLWRSRYCFVTGDYDTSERYLDSAINLYSMQLTEERILRAELERVKLLMAKGLPDAAIDHYTTHLLALDSVRQRMIVEQQDYLTEQSNMLKERERSESLQQWLALIMAIIAGVALITVVAFLVSVVRMRRRLKHNHDITAQNLREANNADKEKEAFLRNMTTLINTPLQMVVRDAKRLSDDTQLTNEQRSQLVAANNEHVGQLLQLVNNVLDLSRLEAGMMKYSVEEVDVVQLLKTFIDDYNFNHLATPILATYNVRNYVAAIDSARFIHMVESLFAKPYRCDTPLPRHRAVITETDQRGRLRCRIKGSLFADDSSMSEAGRMTNRINSLICRDLHYTYEITADNDILITLN